MSPYKYCNAAPITLMTDSEVDFLQDLLLHECCYTESGSCRAAVSGTSSQGGENFGVSYSRSSIRVCSVCFTLGGVVLHVVFCLAHRYTFGDKWLVRLAFLHPSVGEINNHRLAWFAHRRPMYPSHHQFMHVTASAT
jgi:hypothetical protein